MKSILLNSCSDLLSFWRDDVQMEVETLVCENANRRAAQEVGEYSETYSAARNGFFRTAIGFAVEQLNKVVPVNHQFRDGGNVFGCL